jgi:hypothetical protein
MDLRSSPRFPFAIACTVAASITHLASFAESANASVRELPWNEETPFLAIVNYFDNDVSWTDRLRHPHVVYHKNRPDKEPFSAANKAKAESIALKFFDDFYDFLPQNIIIVHQYEHKNFSHVGSIVDILNDENLESKYNASKTVGYWSFGTQRMESVRHHLGIMVESGWWGNCMKPYFGPIKDVGDFLLGKLCCSQYIVSRERVRSLPREFYRNHYGWLV